MILFFHVGREFFEIWPAGTFCVYSRVRNKRRAMFIQIVFFRLVVDQQANIYHERGTFIPGPGCAYSGLKRMRENSMKQIRGHTLITLTIYPCMHFDYTRNQALRSWF